MPISAEVVARELKRMTLQKAASELLRYTDKTVRETLEILTNAYKPRKFTMTPRHEMMIPYKKYKEAQDFGPKPNSTGLNCL